MGFRHSGRKIAIQALYLSHSGRDFYESLESYLESTHFEEKAEEWGKILAINAWIHREKNDKIISEYAQGWSLDRISLVDLSILRLAFYELSLNETPHSVILNEAIELAKEFSSDDAPKFINGILGKYVKKCLQV